MDQPGKVNWSYVVLGGAGAVVLLYALAYFIRWVNGVLDQW